MGKYFDDHNNSALHSKQKRKRKWQQKVTGPTDISIRYRNSKGEVKTFEGWRKTIEVTGNHMNILVAPDKVRIALNQDRILNQDELDALPALPAQEDDSYDYSQFLYRGPEAERCPVHHFLFLVDQGDSHYCPGCKKDYTPQQLGWIGDAAIGYRNFEGEQKVFNAVWNSITSKGNTISVRVEPTFQRITLQREGIIADKLIRYRNFRGEEKEFEALACSMKPSNAHVNVWVAPTFTRIALKQDNILEQRDLETEAPPVIDEPIEPAEPELDEPVVSELPMVNIVVTAIGSTSYEATKVLQKARPDLGTFDVYGLLRDFPKVVAENLPREEAETIKQELEEAGCTVELK